MSDARIEVYALIGGAVAVAVECREPAEDATAIASGPHPDDTALRTALADAVYHHKMRGCGGCPLHTLEVARG